MKKVFILVLLVGAAGSLATALEPRSLAGTTPQQQTQTGSATGSDLLSKVSAVYNGYKTIRADFSFVYFRNEQDLIGQSEEGILWLDQTNGKYRISTEAQELISDGSTQWAVLKEAEEVQITETTAQDGSITPLNVFSFFNKGYAMQQLGGERTGNIQLDVIELTPEDGRKTYSKIKLRINKASHHIVDVTVFDKNNSRYRYTILDLRANEPIAAGRFDFDPAAYPGMEIVDLR